MCPNINQINSYFTYCTYDQKSCSLSFSLLKDDLDTCMKLKNIEIAKIVKTKSVVN